MENKVVDIIARALNVEMPHSDSMDGYLNQILPVVRPWGEDLREQNFYMEKAWMEMRDDVNFHEAVLHFFNDEGEYLRSIDGDVKKGSWRHLERSNKFLIELDDDVELFDLAFLDDQFFILDKHGDQQRLGKNKFTVFIFEPLAKKLEWRDAMEHLFNKYRNNNSSYVVLTLIVLVIIAIIFILSFW